MTNKELIKTTHDICGRITLFCNCCENCKTEKWYPLTEVEKLEREIEDYKKVLKDKNFNDNMVGALGFFDRLHMLEKENKELKQLICEQQKYNDKLQEEIIK